MANDKITLIGFPNLIEHPSTVLTAGSQNALNGPGNLKYRKPSLPFLTGSTSSLSSWLHADFTSIVNEDKRIAGVAVVNHNFNQYTKNLGTNYLPVSNSSYRIRLDQNSISHHLLPTSMPQLANLSGSYTYVQENPAEKSPTGNWLTLTAAPTATVKARFAFPFVSQNLSTDDQVAYFLIRPYSGLTGTVQVQASIYNGSTFVSIIGTQFITFLPGFTGSQIVSFTWNKSVYNIPPSNVQILIEGIWFSGSTNIEIGAVMWDINHEVSFDSGWNVVPLPAYTKKVMLQFQYFLDSTPTFDVNAMLLSWTNNGNPDGFSQIGSLVAGAVVSPDDQIDWGSGQIRLDDPVENVQTTGGNDLFRGANKLRRRSMKITMDNVLQDNALKNFWGKCMAMKGKSEPFYACLHPDKPEYANELSLYCRFLDSFDINPSGVTEGELDYLLSGLTLIEVQ